ncbi:MAG: glycosyltransferase [Candidatus Nanopelagicaceae bacterium]|nr:glycosyltransferase [Candidatus Nanopelagicaceae bacterium]
MPDAQSAARPRVTAILVVHDGAAWLPEVVASLASQTRPIDYTLAIDTGSEDSSLRLLKNARVPSFSMPRDTGFGAAVSVALEHIPTSSIGSEWLWLIHDDCAPQPGALEALLTAVEDRPQVAIAGPKLRGWYDRTHLLEAGVSIAGNGARWTGLETHEYDQGQHDGIRDVLSVSTAGMLIRRDVFEELSGFDPNLSLFRDDVDLGWRAHVAGHKVITVTDAVAYHAEAASSERRGVDVKSAFLHRPLILDRRNAAYVLLANSSWWHLPWLTLQLFSSALVRAVGYLLAKLPGYASDEILAVGYLIIRPGIIFEARKLRRRQRLISSRVVSTFIPPRWSQLRLSTIRATEAIRTTLLPAAPEPVGALETESEDEDLLVPAAPVRWISILRRPEVSGLLFLLALTSLWSSHRYGPLVGGALSDAPVGASDLWSRYGESWHQVGMGSSTATPTWILVLALLSTLFLGKAVFFVTFFFWAAPLLFMLSMYSLLRKFSTNSWLTVGASIGYALSPVAVASINSGRLGTIATLILLPRIVYYIPRLNGIERSHWRFIFGFSLLVGVLISFTLQAFLGIALFHIFSMFRDYQDYRISQNLKLFQDRLARRSTLVVVPFLLCLPWSFEALIHPSRFLLEPGISIPGGGPNLAIIANPGGPGSVPWWFISPITLLLIGSLFSASITRKYAQAGFAFLLGATLLSVASFSSHASSTKSLLWVGTLLTFSTVAAICCAVIILNGLRKRLAKSHFHYRHTVAGLVIATTVVYALTTSVWAATAGANSPVRADQGTILPAYLAVTPGVKTLVLRNLEDEKVTTLSFYIARERDSLLADPDVAPPPSTAIETAVREMVDGSGINSSKVLSAHGIKYIFMKNPVDSQVVRTMDGLGGFLRTSATQDGIVWRVAGVSERLVFTDKNGTAVAIPTDEVSAQFSASGPGTLSLAENYSSGWQVIQQGKQLVRSRNAFGLPQFNVPRSGEFILIHDGTLRRAWLSLELIVLLVVLVMALPAGRRKREISSERLT